MGFMEDLMRERMGGSDSSNWKAMNAKEIAKAKFEPIVGLKVGDVLKPKAFHKNSKIADANKTVTVYSVDKFSAIERGSPVDRNDFTVLIQRENGDLIECPEDSRYWERA